MPAGASTPPEGPRRITEDGTMKQDRMILRSMAAGCAWLAAAAYGEIFFQENFQNYNLAPGVNAEIGPYVDNDPIWALGANLAVNPGEGKSGDVFVAPIRLPADNRFDVHFRFRLLNSKAAKAAKPAAQDKPGEPAEPADPAFFDLTFRAANGKTQQVRLAADQLAGQTVPFIPNGTWQAFAIKANGKTADLYYAPDRAFVKLRSIPLEATFATVNFSATEKKNFAIGDIVVSTPGVLPSNPVEKHFASFKSLGQPVAGATTVGAAGATVSLVPAPRAGLRFSLGGTNVSSMTIHWNQPDDKGRSTSVTYPIRTAPHWHETRLPVAGLAKGGKTNLVDAAVDFSGFLAQSVRPDLKMYCSSYDMEPQGVDIIRDWASLPPASAHPLDLDFVRQADGKIDVYFDGSLLTTLIRKDGAVATNIVFRFAPGVKYRVKPDALAKTDTDRFTVIDLAANPRAKTFAEATSTLKPGLQDFSGVPIMVAAPLDSADVAICKQGKGNWALEVEEYHGRSPAHGFPSAIHYRLPAAPYGKAHVLFALDPDPAKDRILTVRIGHYIGNGSGGNMLGDVVIDLGGGKLPESYRQVGTVMKNGKEIPLYLAPLDLNLGDILDLASGERYDYVSTGGYLDFEFVGKGWENFEQINRSIKPDPKSESAFNIFGVTLEKIPVKITFRQEQPGNVFTLDEKNRRTTFILTALRDGAKGKVSWRAVDAEGGKVFEGSRDYTLAKAGVSNLVDIALDQARIPGYYTLQVVFDDAMSGCRITHDAAFAILPPAGRKVNKWDSPYAVWWFSAHGSPGTPAIGGPIMQKAGIVRASANGELKDEHYEKYNITSFRIASMDPAVDWKTGTFKPVTVTFPDPDDPTGKKTVKKEYAAEEGTEINLRRALERDPRIDTVMLWHESAPGYGIPEELLGKPVPQDKIAADKALAAKVDLCGRVVKKINKDLGRQVKLQIGNSSASIGAAVRPHRAGARADSYDQIGIETPSQVIPPERLIEVGLQGMVVAKEIAGYYAKQQGVRAPGLNGCWEFTYRCERDMGERQQAEWYMRDVLISLANDFYYISPGILFDCKNGYYNGLWGGSGLLRRAPFCYPKQAYVAYGVLTSVLDGVKYVRQLDTGSTTVYALEFKRQDGKFAYALWAARGEVALELDSTTGGVATHMLGAAETFAKGKAVVNGGTSPTYVVTDKPVDGVRIAGRSFKKDQALAGRAQVAWAIDKADEVALAPDPAFTTGNTRSLPIMLSSDFTVAQVTDEEKGDCIEVALDTSRHTDMSRYITEYTTVRFKEPKPVPGTPAVLGVWVKGNSNWGQIRFEIEDAQGEVFKNETTGPSWGCNIMDWPGNLAVNFDGWGYVYTALKPTTLVNDHSPGPVSEQWVSEGGDKKINFPIKVRAITVGMNRTKLDLLDFKPSAPAIRLKDVGGTEELSKAQAANR